MATDQPPENYKTKESISEDIARHYPTHSEDSGQYFILSKKFSKKTFYPCKSKNILEVTEGVLWVIILAE